MKVSDLISGGLFLALSIFLFLHAEGFVSMPGVPYGPKLFPQIILVIMGGAGLLLMISGARRLPATGWLQLEEWARKRANYGRLAAILGGFALYTLFAETLGYLLTSTLMLMLVLSVTRGARRWGSNLLITGAAVTVIYLIFAYLLRVPLPVGVLERALLGYS